MPRASLLASGVDPPRLGSFQDELLRELDERGRNLRYAEMSLFVRVLVLLLNGREHLAVIDEWMDLYAAELYQDVYTPEHAIEQRAALQRKRAAERAAAEDKARMLKKVEKFSG